MILFQSNTTNTINVQTTLNHDMENHTTSYAYTNIQPKYAMHRNSKRRPIYSPMISRPHMALNEI
ncbi:E3 6.6kDa protein [Human adenovirus 7d2]|uniref:E3 6.6kDa protein n=1 Tax=Human adenovirus 7d2 TaxID=326124 RepID=R4HME8_ADE07|nr:E3 6.6kDa protein [Human adenovirus 7d2]